MLKKFLAGLTAVALSLGLLTLTALPAQAHHSDITATFACTGPSAGTITWSVHNWNGGKVGRVDSSTNGVVPALTPFASDETKTFTQSVTATGTSTLSVTMSWQESDGSWGTTTTNSGSITLSASNFSACQPDDTSRKIVVCHYDNGQGGKWTRNDVDISSILNGTGHGGHNADVIPPFSYVKQGVPGSYPGKNWTTYGQNVWNAGCADVTPPPPTFTDAVCTGPGTWGQGGYTIPAVTGARYLVRLNGGAWTEKSAGTYPVAVGTTVEIKAEALANYGLTGLDAQYSWSDTIGKPSNCDVEVTPVKPVITQAVCQAEGQVGGAGYTIVALAGVRFEKSANGTSGWTEVLPGTYPVADGTSVWIRAVELPGYELAGNDNQYVWKLTFTDIDSRKCVVPATPTPRYAECTTPGESSPASYTIPSDTGIQYQRWENGAWVNVEAGTVIVSVFPATVKLQAIAKPGFTLVGGPYTWTYDFTSAGDCLVKVVPATPKFTDSVCEPQTTGATQGGYIIATTPNVSYTVSLDGGAAVPATTGSFVPTAPGDQVVITAVPATGYVLSGDAGPWSHTFADPGACLDDVAVGAVTAVDQQCVVQEEVDGGGKFGALVHTAIGTYVSGRIVVPNTPHVDYFLEPDLVTPLTPGDHELPPGTYTVRAVAHPGYQLTGYDGPWILEIKAAEPCGDLPDLPIVTPEVTFTHNCLVRSYTLGVVEDGLEAGVVWTVTGGPSTLGTHAVPAAGTVTITATPAPGYGFPGADPDPELTWSYDFAAPADCLPTLAFTGGTVSTGALGFAALLLLGGGLLIARRARQARGEE